MRNLPSSITVTQDETTRSEDQIITLESLQTAVKRLQERPHRRQEICVLPTRPQQYPKPQPIALGG